MHVNEMDGALKKTQLGLVSGVSYYLLLEWEKDQRQFYLNFYSFKCWELLFI